MDWKKQVTDFRAGLEPQSPRISTQAIRFGFFGAVGGGKSVTAGIFSLAITPVGHIGWIDGEGERSGWAIDTVAELAAKYYGTSKADVMARFKVVHVGPPFHPLKVVAALELLEETCATTIMDVMSQAWDSDGGYLDLKDDKLQAMAGDDEAKRKRSAAAAAAGVKPWTHQKLVNKVTTSKCNLVMLFQAKQKFNAAASRPNEFVTPIQESGLTRTAIAVGRVECDGDGVGGLCSFQLPSDQGAKFTHPSILAALPRNGERLTFAHGEAILKLCGGQASVPKRSQQEELITLWTLLKPIRIPGDRDWKVPQQWLWDEAIMMDTEFVREVSAARLLEIIAAAETKLAGIARLILSARGV